MSIKPDCGLIWAFLNIFSKPCYFKTIMEMNIVCSGFIAHYLKKIKQIELCIFQNNFHHSISETKVCTYYSTLPYVVKCVGLSSMQLETFWRLTAVLERAWTVASSERLFSLIETFDKNDRIIPTSGQ